MYILFVTVPDPVVKDYGISAQVYDPAVLTCNVTGIPLGTTITYQWKRADLSPVSAVFSPTRILYLPYVGVSDAGVYICEVTVSDSSNNPHVISGTGSVNVILTVTSKWRYKLLSFTFFSLQVWLHQIPMHIEAVNEIAVMY